MAGENQITIGAIQDAFKASFQDWQASQPKPQPASPETVEASAPPVPVPAEMGQGFVHAIDNFRVPVLNVRLPWASAVIGLGAGTIVGNTIDAVVPQKNLLNPVLQLVAAGAEARFLGGDMGKFAAGAHVIKLALRYTPLGNLLAQAEGMLARPLGGVRSALGGQESFAQMPPLSYDHNQPAPGFTNVASPAWN